MTRPVSPFSQVEDGFPEITSHFSLFCIYWDVCSKRGTEYTASQVLNITSGIYRILRDFWVQKGWDIDEIKTVSSALDAKNEMLNSNLFFNKKLSYILHMRNWYLIFLFFLIRWIQFLIMNVN